MNEFHFFINTIALFLNYLIKYAVIRRLNFAATIRLSGLL